MPVTGSGKGKWWSWRGGKISANGNGNELNMSCLTCGAISNCGEVNSSWKLREIHNESERSYLVVVVVGNPMGRVFLVELQGRSFYKCRFCHTHLALSDNVLSWVLSFFSSILSLFIVFDRNQIQFVWFGYWKFVVLKFIGIQYIG